MKRTKLITLATGLMLTFSVSVFADEKPLQITPEAQAYADKLIQLSKNDQMAVINELTNIPKGMRGMAIVLVTAGLLSLAFMGFSGVDVGLRKLMGIE